jgi:hypothetical protein
MAERLDARMIDGLLDTTAVEEALIDTAAVRVATDAARINAEGVVSSASQVFAARETVAADRIAIEATVEGLPDALTNGWSERYSIGLAVGETDQDRMFVLGYDPARDRTHLHNPEADRISAGELDLGGGDVRVGYSARYVMRGDYADGTAAWGIRRDGVVEIDGVAITQSGGSSDLVNADWATDTLTEMVLGIQFGQSTATGIHALVNAGHDQPVAAGRAFMLRSPEGRIGVFGDAPSSYATRIAERSRYTTLVNLCATTFYDARGVKRVAATGEDKSWAEAKLLLPGLPMTMGLIAHNTSIGGQPTEVMAGAMRDNTRRSILMSTEHCRARGATLRAAYMTFDGGGANRGDNVEQRVAKLYDGVFGDYLEDLRRGAAFSAAQLADCCLVISGCAYPHNSARWTSLVAEGDLQIVLQKSQAIWSCPGYLTSVAGPGLIAEGSTPEYVHSDETGYAILGAYAGRALRRWFGDLGWTMDGNVRVYGQRVKSLPLYATGATLSGRVVTITYANPIPGSQLALDTSWVSDPASTNELDARRPYGFAILPTAGDPVKPALAALPLIVPGSFQILSSTQIRFTLDRDVAAGAYYVNYAAFYDMTGDPEIDPADNVQGHLKGARGCLRNTAPNDAANSITITNPAYPTGLHFVLHDYAAAQRIPLIAA